MNKDLLTLEDLNAHEIMGLLDRGLQMKKAGRDMHRPLKGYTLGLIFDKSSTRTRVSFEAAMFRLGGETLFLSRQDTQLSRNEALKDTARVLSRYLDALVIRTFSQEIIEEMARFADIPVINALTDQFHPCQILSDLMTIKEKGGDLQNMKVAWIGDGNNVANSWVNAAHILGFELALACPKGYTPKAEILEKTGNNIYLVTEPKKAAEGADVINTDVWASMGQEAERDQRIRDFKGFQVNPSLVGLGKPNVLIMHCLPAHRGEEITAEVLEGHHSIVFDQAENKMHLHQALLEKILVKR